MLHFVLCCLFDYCASIFITFVRMHAYINYINDCCIFALITFVFMYALSYYIYNCTSTFITFVCMYACIILCSLLRVHTHISWRNPPGCRTITRVRVIDRVKNIFKLSNGEWVSPERVEGLLLGACSWLRQVFVHGDSAHTRVMALVVVDGDSDTFADGKSIDKLDTKPSISKSDPDGDDAALRERIATAFRVRAKELSLADTEVPLAKNMVVLREPFTLETGLLTRTLKLNRRAIRKRYSVAIAAILDKMQASDNQSKSSETKRMQSTLSEILTRAMAGGASEEDKEAWSRANAGTESLQHILVQSVVQRTCGVPLSLAVIQQYSGDPDSLAACIRASRRGKGPSTVAVDWTREVQPQPLPLALLGLKREAVVLNDENETSVESERSRADDWFLTGVTGFFGSALLFYLLRRLIPEISTTEEDTTASSHASVAGSSPPLPPSGISFGSGTTPVFHCLVRAKGQGSAQNALEKCMFAQGYLSRTQTKQLIRKGIIRVVCGDLSKPMLGLSLPVFSALAMSVRFYVHCGAKVDHFNDYRGLRDVNVEGSRRVMQLVALRARLLQGADKPMLFYMSSSSIITDPTNAQTLGTPGVDRGGYVNSKIVTEHILSKASMSHNFDLRIHRLGLLGPDGNNGAANLNDWMMRFVTGCIELDGYHIAEPDADTSVDVELAPVDCAANALIDSMLASTRAGGSVASIIQPQQMQYRVGMEEFMQMVAKSNIFMPKLIPLLDLDTWRQRLREMQPTNPLYVYRDCPLL